MKDAFDEASVRLQLKFLYGSIKENVIQICYFLSRNNDNREFIAFLVSGKEQSVMTNNNLSIHVESGNIFYQNFNTNENFSSFLIARQDERKAIITTCISYHYRFEKYINTYLPTFSIEDAEKNYKISRRVYQALFIDITDSFVGYIHSLGINEIHEFEDDLKANG